MTSPTPRHLSPLTLLPALGVFVFCLLAAGCLSPGTIKPIATDNLQNVQNLQANLQPLLDDYRNLVAVVGRAKYQQRLQILAGILDGYVRSGGAIDEDRLDAEITTLRAVLEHFESLSSTPENLAARKRELALDKPVVGDIAAGFLKRDEALAIIRSVAAINASSLSNEAQFAAHEIYLRDFHLASSSLQTLNDTLAAVDAYNALLNQQSALATSHAKAFAAFSESKAHFSAILDATLSDPSIQTTIADLVLKNTGDPQRKAEAEKLLNSLSSK